MISAFNAASISQSASAVSTLRQSQEATQPKAGAVDFSSVLQSVASSAVDTLRQGEAAAAQGILGTLPVQQVVDQVMAAERTLQATLAIRDKLVGAYTEISRMQI